MRILPNDKKLQYCGRIDFDDELAPVLVYCGSFVRMRFTGTSVKAVLVNKWTYANDLMGYILDGEQGKFELEKVEGEKTYVIAENLGEGVHDLLFFKRKAACHIVTFLGFEVDDDAALYDVPPLPDRKIEVFGDSVSCGEVAEAFDYVGKLDPEHLGEMDNAWYSYSWIAARKLDAQVHITSQGGIALLDGTGWFHAPNLLGMEHSYDKIEYNDECGPLKPWDFSLYRPHLVIIAIGQNDAHPDNYMELDYNCEKAVNWREHYQAFVEKLMEIYPKAHFILATTILMHHKNWDDSIEEVTQKIGSGRVHHFLYSNNGAGTPGHIRAQEAEGMATELAAYVETLGNIWGEQDVSPEGTFI